MMTKYLALTIFMVLALAFVASDVALAQEMSKDQWQAEMTRLTDKKTDLIARTSKLETDITDLSAKVEKATADVRDCEDALYAMLGVTRADVEAYDSELAGIEARVAELQRMSDAELLNHREEIERLNARLAEMAESKIALIPRYGNRVSSLQAKVDALMKSLQREKTYTVGTWSRDRDCLWNIAKKTDIYDNAWLWPKIWQGNRDVIRDPDIIQPKWVLKIPEGAELSKDEKSAANRYYRSKAAAEPADMP
jgi:septal ring factor EnvC (AmiA/AmiB activator)